MLPGVIKDLGELDFVKGGPSKKYKYKVEIPAEMWNKWRDDKIKTKRTIKFGAQGYQQFFDRIGEWKNMDHHDEKRRDSYKKRHGVITTNVNGKDIKSYKLPFSAEFFSYYLLW